MFRKLFKAIFKLGLYATCAGAIWGAWDFMQQSSAAGDDYGVAEHMASLDDRYGDDVRAMSNSAVLFAQSGLAQSVEMVESSGVLEQIGVEMPEQMRALVPGLDATADTSVEPIGDQADAAVGDGQDEAIVVASAKRVIAPETSLLPRQRPLR